MSVFQGVRGARGDPGREGNPGPFGEAGLPGPPGGMVNNFNYVPGELGMTINNLTTEYQQAYIALICL